jgi:hemolysin activation/secretion protein
LATGRLPLQESFYVGGKGTLPGYGDRKFVGDRTVLYRMRLSWGEEFPGGRIMQDRFFVGFDAGNAWERSLRKDVPHLRTDFVVGFGVMRLTNGFLFPVGLTFSWSRPIDRRDGNWRFHVDLFGAPMRQRANSPFADPEQAE